MKKYQDEDLSPYTSRRCMSITYAQPLVLIGVLALHDFQQARHEMRFIYLRAFVCFSAPMCMVVVCLLFSPFFLFFLFFSSFLSFFASLLLCLQSQVCPSTSPPTQWKLKTWSWISWTWCDPEPMLLHLQLYRTGMYSIMFLDEEAWDLPFIYIYILFKLLAFSMELFELLDDIFFVSMQDYRLRCGAGHGRPLDACIV